MKLVGGETEYRSYMGSISTLIVFVFMIGYSYTKLSTLIERKYADVIKADFEQHFSDADQFSAVNNDFFLAAALTHYDSNTEILERKEYGELRIGRLSWGNEDIGLSYGVKTPENHYCSDEEMGFVQGPKTRIFPIYERSKAEVNIYRKKFKCIDED